PSRAIAVDRCYFVFGMRKRMAPCGFFAALFVFGCGSSESSQKPQPEPDAGVDSGGDLPPRICKAPAAHDTPWFVEETACVGLGPCPWREPLANQFVAADLDGDGWADLMAVRGESARGLIDGKRTRFLFMNRPAGSQAGARKFEDQPTLNGLGATREGGSDR